MKEFKILLLLITGFSAFMSCEDESIDVTEMGIEQKQSDQLDFEINSMSLPDIKIVDVPFKQQYSALNGMQNADKVLQFKSMADYERAIEFLEMLSEAHDDKFVQAYNHLSDDELNDLEEKIGHDSEKPMTDFETSMGFKSLRKQILEEEEIFLNQEFPNWDEDPDNHFIFDDGERALLNANAQVLVGTDFYTFQENGYTKMSLTGTQESEVVLYDDANVMSHGCRRTGKDVGHHSFSSSRRIKWKNKFRGRWTEYGFDGDMIKTKTTSYKRKKRRWKKYRTSISAGIRGRARSSGLNSLPGSCRTYNYFHNHLKTKRRKKVKYQIGGSLYLVIDLYTGLRLAPQEMFSVHRQGNNEYTHEIYD